MAPYLDPEDQRRYSREWYKRNRQKVIDKSRERNLKTKHAKREVLTDAKDRPCVDCGQRFPKHSMEFHHVRGKKVAAVGNMINNNTHSVADLLAEIEKCVLLCVICHRERHHGKK